jgi:carbamoyltransferase
MIQEVKRNYVGLACTFHDSALAIVDSNGEVAFAEATERYTQSKKAINMVPDQLHRIMGLIDEYVEPGADVTLCFSWSDEAIEAFKKARAQMDKFKTDMESQFHGSPPAHINLLIYRALFGLSSNIRSLDLASKTFFHELKLYDHWLQGREIAVRKYDHHTTHAAAACFTSPFANATCAIIDGHGEDTASKSFSYRDGRLSALSIDETGNNGSLGFFFAAVCRACGFGIMSGEEWKVMGLAPYGKLDEQLYEVFKTGLRVDGLSIGYIRPADHVRVLGELEKRKRKRDEPPVSCADLAFTAQCFFSEIVYEYLNNLHERSPSDNVVLGGGCFLNSSTNGEITERTPFEDAYVFCSPGDDGNAVGAALLGYYDDHPQAKPSGKHQTPYLGSRISTESMEKLRKHSKVLRPRSHKDAVFAETAKLLANEKIVAWVQGRAEFGPRALGNRSILADPRSLSMKDRINAEIKYRDAFPPFALSVLHEYGSIFFENYEETPYMERTLRFRPKIRAKVPAVVHVDGTGRLQTVKFEWNAAYYRLIQAFHGISGVPMLLNTSLNVMGKPIVHSLEDVLAVFLTSGIDALVIEDEILVK